MKIEDLIALSVLAIFFTMLAIERIWPARQFPRVPFWHVIGMGLFIYASAVNVLLPTLLPTEWIATHKLFDLSTVGLLPSILIGHLAITLATFVWHLATHEINFLWRGFHQLHHAPRHLNIYATNCMHPGDLFVYLLIPWFVGLFVLGVSPLAAAILGGLGGFVAFFQHWNVRTPRWLGYLIQRPESHCIHHERGQHRFNYSDFPLWDIIWGTFRNPSTWQGETGFDEPADRRYAAMLACVDVNAPLMGSHRQGQPLGRTPAK